VVIAADREPSSSKITITAVLFVVELVFGSFSIEYDMLE
jgi:hypothetical protein